VPAVAIGAQHSALVDLGKEVYSTAHGGNHHYFTNFVAQMVEVEHDRICLAAHNARMLAQVVVDVGSISMLSR
jgi:hypothetical protein